MNVYDLAMIVMEEFKEPHNYDYSRAGVCCGQLIGFFGLQGRVSALCLLLIALFGMQFIAALNLRIKLESGKYSMYLFLRFWRTLKLDFSLFSHAWVAHIFMRILAFSILHFEVTNPSKASKHNSSSSFFPE